MNGYELLDYLNSGMAGRIRRCVENNSDTYAIFSCPRKYEKKVMEELERLHIGTSPVPTNDRKTAEYVILKRRREEVEEVVKSVIEQSRRKSRFR